MSDYGTPPPPPPALGYNPGGVGGPPQNYLVWAILSTVFCCLPLGVASIVFAAQVNSKWQAGDARGAAESSVKAKKFAMWSAIAGVVGAIVWVFFVFVVAALSEGS
ncbi:MAG: CD225/dispanin family protein [Pedococcus sp.]